jgi:hypothetical protein
MNIALSPYAAFAPRGLPPLAETPLAALRNSLNINNLLRL